VKNRPIPSFSEGSAKTAGGRSAYTTEAIQQAIAQGAITEAYQADPQQVIQELNRLRATEVTSYLQYKQHAYMAVSLFAPGLKDDFEAHATLELQHADLLAQRIQQLGGSPSITRSTSRRRRRPSVCAPSKAPRCGR
jgi:ferritin-like protein